MEYEEFLARRYVRVPCEACHGLGVKMYGSTAIWRGGLGGQAMTPGVCDTCWGSGDKNRIWDDLRKMRDEEESRVADRAAKFLESSIGANLGILKPAFQRLILKLNILSKKKDADRNFQNVCRYLTTTISKILESVKD